MKKALSIFLSLLMLCCVLPAGAAFAEEPAAALTEGACGEKAVYAYNADDKTLTVSGSGAIDDYNYSKKPSPFIGNKEIEKIVISEGVTKIGKHAFEGCKSLKTVELPDGLKVINMYAFKDCTALTAIKIPDSVKTIGEGAFSGCVKLKKAVFGKRVKTIGKNAFYGCTVLTTVKLNAKLKKIAPFAFFNCKSIKRMFIPKSVKSIGSGALGLYYKGKGKKSKLCRNKKYVIVSNGSAAAKKYAKDNGFKFKNSKS